MGYLYEKLDMKGCVCMVFVCEARYGGVYMGYLYEKLDMEGCIWGICMRS